MNIYRCKKTFLCTPLKKYIPKGAMIARFVNTVKIVIQDAPESDTNPFNILADGIQYDEPTMVTWLWKVEPPPLGTNTTLFEFVSSKAEDAYGNVGSTPDGLPLNSQFHIRVSDGQAFMKSVTNGLWYPIRISGTNGSAVLQVGQTGEVL